MNIEKEIRKYALENAISFEGKCNPGPIIGKLLSKDPALKKDMKKLSIKINTIVKEVNLLSPEEQEKQLLEIIPDYHEKEKEKKVKRREERQELPELKNAVEGKVRTRIAPEPSKYNHFGHAISFLLNYMYADKYKGECILRFEDTNPEKSNIEYVEAMKEDVLEYLGIKPKETVYVSDHMDTYYEYAEKLIEEDKTYTCTCKQEDISKLRRAMQECDCRNKSKEEVKKEWQAMKNGEYEQGTITLRLKIDMAHKNAVMRDPVIFRLGYTSHYRQKDKYKVWPMYDFENGIEEGLLKITHVLRSNEFETRIELQNYIRNLFNLPNPEIRQYARYNITGAVTKGREIREMIASGNFIGWDDPRLVTLRALKRRGIVKEAYYELAKIIGMSKTTSNLDFEVLASINRKILDNSAKRFFFIKEPIKITIEGCPNKEVNLKLHPEKDQGERKFHVDEDFYLEKKDIEKINDGDIIRLMDCLNFTKDGDSFRYIDDDLETYKKGGKMIIHWLPVKENIEISVFMPDALMIKGLAERNIEMLEENEVVQFERYAFCRLDNKENKTFWFTHK